MLLLTTPGCLNTGEGDVNDEGDEELSSLCTDEVTVAVEVEAELLIEWGVVDVR